MKEGRDGEGTSVSDRCEHPFRAFRSTPHHSHGKKKGTHTQSVKGVNLLCDIFCDCFSIRYSSSRLLNMRVVIAYPRSLPSRHATAYTQQLEHTRHPQFMQ